MPSEMRLEMPSDMPLELLAIKGVALENEVQDSGSGDVDGVFGEVVKNPGELLFGSEGIWARELHGEVKACFFFRGEVVKSSNGASL